MNPHYIANATTDKTAEDGRRVTIAQNGADSSAAAKTPTGISGGFRTRSQALRGMYRDDLIQKLQGYGLAPPHHFTVPQCADMIIAHEDAQGLTPRFRELHATGITSLRRQVALAGGDVSNLKAVSRLKTIELLMALESEPSTMPTSDAALAVLPLQSRRCCCCRC